MKRIGLMGLIGFITLGVMAQMAYKPLNQDVPDSSTKIIVSATPTNTTAFSSNAVVAAGTVLTYSNLYYLVVAGGTTTNYLPQNYDGDMSNGTAVLRWVWPVRESVLLQNSGTGNVYLAYGNAAEAGKGLVLLPSYGNSIRIKGNVSVFGVSDTGITNRVLIHAE